MMFAFSHGLYGNWTTSNISLCANSGRICLHMTSILVELFQNRSSFL